MGSSPIGSIAAESEIFLGESGFPPFLFSPLKCRDEKIDGGKANDANNGAYGRIRLFQAIPVSHNVAHRQVIPSALNGYYRFR